MHSLHIVLLVGGPGGSLAGDLRRATKSESGTAPRPGSLLAKRLQLIKKPICSSEEYVPLPSVSVCGLSVLEAWVTALQFCLHRVQSLSEQVHVVCNEVDQQDVQQVLESVSGQGWCAEALLLMICMYGIRVVIAGRVCRR